MFSRTLYVQHPVSKNLHISPRFSPTIFYRDANSVLQNPLCAASCVTRDIPVSPRFSPTFFYPDANSVLLRAHFCSAVDSKPCVRKCSRERGGLYNGNAQQNSLCAASCVTKDIPVSPRFSPTFFIAGQIQHPMYSAQFLIHSSPN